MSIIGKSITIHGFIVGSLHGKYEEDFYREVPAKVAGGRVKFTEDVRYGLESVGQAIEDVQRGRNTGKTVIVVDDE
jgi:NADPH-dependent curcumin reductase CurA